MNIETVQTPTREEAMTRSENQENPEGQIELTESYIDKQGELIGEIAEALQTEQEASPEENDSEFETVNEEVEENKNMLSRLKNTLKALQAENPNHEEHEHGEHHHDSREEGILTAVAMVTDIMYKTGFTEAKYVKYGATALTGFVGWAKAVEKQGFTDGTREGLKKVGTSASAIFGTLGIHDFLQSVRKNEHGHEHSEQIEEINTEAEMPLTEFYEHIEEHNKTIAGKTLDFIKTKFEQSNKLALGIGTLEVANIILSTIDPSLLETLHMSKPVIAGMLAAGTLGLKFQHLKHAESVGDIAHKIEEKTMDVVNKVKSNISGLFRNPTGDRKITYENTSGPIQDIPEEIAFT